MSSPLLSSFRSIEEYRTHTNHIFELNFQQYLERIAYDSTGYPRLPPNVLTDSKLMAQAVLLQRGKGIESWLLLQSFRQCLEGKDNHIYREQVDMLAVAYYAQVTAHEILDDLPGADNDATRRGQPAIWKQFGERRAVNFSKQLSNFALFLLNNLPDLEPQTRQALIEDYLLADTLVAHGQRMVWTPEDKEAIRTSGNIFLLSYYHKLKAAWHSGYLMETGAILTGGAGGLKATAMRSLGVALGQLGQIVNDVALEDVLHDRESQAPNIVEACIIAQQGDVKQGVEMVKEEFARHVQQALVIVERCHKPNEQLVHFITAQEHKFLQKIATVTPASYPTPDYLEQVLKETPNSPSEIPADPFQVRPAPAPQRGPGSHRRER